MTRAETVSSSRVDRQPHSDFPFHTSWAAEDAADHVRQARTEYISTRGKQKGVANMTRVAVRVASMSSSYFPKVRSTDGSTKQSYKHYLGG